MNYTLVFMGGAIFCMKTKDELRKIYKEKTKNLSKDYIAKESALIFQTLMNVEEYKSAKSVFVYKSTFSEVDTEKIISQAFLDGKRVSVPKIVGKQIVPVQISAESVFEKNRYGIFEPTNGMKVEDTDLCIIPLVAFSRNKARLGHGGGYYDRFLSDFHGFKLAIALSVQETEFIPRDENDIFMDMIITEKEIIK